MRIDLFNHPPENYLKPDMNPESASTTTTSAMTRAGMERTSPECAKWWCWIAKKKAQVVPRFFHRLHGLAACSAVGCSLDRGLRVQQRVCTGGDLLITTLLLFVDQLAVAVASNQADVLEGCSARLDLARANKRAGSRAFQSKPPASVPD